MDVVLIRMTYAQQLWNEETVHAPQIAATPTPTPAPISAPASTSSPSFVPTTPEDKVDAFQKIIHVFDKNREPLIADYLRHNIGLVDMASGVITVTVLTPAAENMHTRIQKLLLELTGERWRIDTVNAPQALSIAALEKQKKETQREQILNRPDVQKITALFPNAHINVD